MRDLMNYTTRVLDAFEGKEENISEFNTLLLNTSNRIYDKYSKDEANSIIRTQLNTILGYTDGMTPMKRRQAWRLHAPEIYSIIEDVIADKMVSGWGENPFFEQFCETKNLALGDKNEFYVEENSLLQVSQFAGNHHDIVRQKVGFGKSFTVETSRYAIKVYQDYELFRAGKVDFAKLIDKMYLSIEKYRKDAIYTAFMKAEENLPTDLVIDNQVTEESVSDIIDLAEEIKTVTGKDVIFVGTKVALQKLARTVNYNLWSDAMKDELHKTGELGAWEGYQLIAIPRVNELNSRKEVTDNTKILIVPNDPEFKPIKIVNEGDVAYYETGMDGSKKDMTIDAELAYIEGIAVVINQLYGVVNISK
jgi:hypothetical protein|nr:MAG TPA: capsid protein [Caudoviricetes sp.]